jgi:general stress protein YciG
LAARAPRPHLHGNQTERMEIMAGTREGGRHAAATNRAKYGKDFYRKIGAMGGKAGRTGGFFANRELARIAGAKGGRSRRKED